MYIDVAREAVAYYAADADLQHLLAVLIGKGATPEICGKLSAIGVRILAEMSVSELMAEGLMRQEAERIVAAFGLARKLASSQKGQPYIVRTPEDAAQYLMEEMRHLKQEHFVVLLLDTKKQVIAHETIFVGSLNASIVHPREVFRAAIKRNCASIICAHNHPSGDPTPSPEDLDVTRRLVEVGKTVGIEVLDHIVIGDSAYSSLKERGMI
ncbi:MAG: DNA repair protein RadC [Bacillus thermozeamaize]|uniref:DNA repair protein RadC n=1 Tax=Bacillus thermozeamaize TaxID=230954 RepID=A0A1Y3PKJ1_9BACI|nr:MAG: DNA repair protein RadC [Bacillus thermozeamaize]